MSAPRREPRTRSREQRAALWYELGRVGSEGADWTRAIVAFRQAVKLEPGHARAWHELGVAHRAAGDLSKATSAVREALRSDPSLDAARVTLIELLADRGEEGAARAMVEQYVRDRPEAASSLYVRFVGGRRVLAAAAMRQAVACGCQDEQTWLALGLVSDNHAEAISALRNAVSLNDHLAEAWLALGERHDMSDWSAMDDAMSRSTTLRPSNAYGWFLYGDALFGLDRLDGAAGPYAKAVELEPDNVAALLNLGDTESLLHRHRSAQRAFEAAICLEPWRFEGSWHRSSEESWHDFIIAACNVEEVDAARHACEGSTLPENWYALCSTPSATT